MKHERGASLVSLMVGVAISLIVVVGMMSLYKNTVKISAHASQDAKFDSNRTASFLSAGMSLQSAAFGIENPNSADEIKIISGASLSAANKLLGTLVTAPPRTGNAIVWRSLTEAGGASECTGLYAPAAGGLVLLNNMACSSASDWSTLTWTQAQIMPASNAKASTDLGGTEIDDSISFTVKTQVCTPLGVDTASGNLMVEMKTKNSNNLDASNSTCLANFAAPTPAPTATPAP